MQENDFTMTKPCYFNLTNTHAFEEIEVYNL